MDNQFTIKRNANCNYLFDLVTPNYIMTGYTLEDIQAMLGIIPEDFARIDDGRYMLMI